MTAHYSPAVLAGLVTLVLSTSSCPSFGCEDCEYLPCAAECTEGDCQLGFSSSLDAPISSEPVQWLTRLTVGGCQDVFDEGDRLVRIQCDAERGSIFADIIYSENGHARAIDVHDYPNQLETASQRFNLVTDDDGQIIESTLVFLNEIERVETFTWDGDHVASVEAKQSRGDFVDNTAFGYDEAGTLRTVDTVPTRFAGEHCICAKLNGPSYARTIDPEIPLIIDRDRISEARWSTRLLSLPTSRLTNWRPRRGLARTATSAPESKPFVS